MADQDSAAIRFLSTHGSFLQMRGSVVREIEEQIKTSPQKWTKHTTAPKYSKQKKKLQILPKLVFYHNIVNRGQRVLIDWLIDFL